MREKELELECSKMFLLKALSDYLTITGCPLEKAQKCDSFHLFLVVVLLTCANL